MTPGRPNGSTAVRIISHWVAPSASAPSLCVTRRLVEDLARQMAVTIGRIMIASTMPMKKIVPPLMPGRVEEREPAEDVLRATPWTGDDEAPKTSVPQRP